MIVARRTSHIEVERASLPDGVEQHLLERGTHVVGIGGRGSSPIVRTAMVAGDVLYLPYALEGELRRKLAARGVSLRVLPPPRARVEHGLVSGDFEPRAPQARIMELVRGHDTGQFFVATGVGKSEAALMAIEDSREPALIVVPDVALATQWASRAESFLGARVGIVGGGRGEVRPLTVCVPAAARDGSETHVRLVSAPWGSVWVDECQAAGTPGTLHLLEKLRARRCYGLSADGGRADGRDLVAADWLGPVRLRVSRDEAVDEGWILPVTVELVPTTYGRRAGATPPGDGAEYDRLLALLAADDERERLLDLVVLREIEGGHGPVAVLTHRREHASSIAVRWESGRLLGGARHRREFEGTLRELRDGDAVVACGTIQAMGVGKDVRGLGSVVVATPFGSGWARGFDQLMGRACRLAPGKSRGRVVVLEDRRLYQDQLARRVLSWTGRTTEVLRRRDDGGVDILRAR